MITRASVEDPWIRCQLLVARAHQKFDQTGTLIDQATRGFLATSPETFSAWVAHFASS
jgi:hypothetical protein